MADPEAPQCAALLLQLLSNETTAGSLTNGTILLETSFTFLCDNLNNTRVFAALPQFMVTLWQTYAVRVGWLFSQSASITTDAGITAWLAAAVATLPALEELVPYRPELHFDVEYSQTVEDAERVLGQAWAVRQFLEKGFVPQARPRLGWAVNTASFLALPTSFATCPIDNTTQLIGECFARIVDTIAIMDYRSYAIEEPGTGRCDGIVVRGQGMFAIAAKYGTKVRIGIETSCDLGVYQTEESFCGESQSYHTNDPLGYMFQSLYDTQKYLQNTTQAVLDYPCCTQEEAPVPSVVPGLDLWTNIADWPPFIVEDFAALSFLAYQQSVQDACSLPSYSWMSCLN